MTSYTFHLGRLLADPQQGTVLLLHTLETPAELRVRVCGADAELIAIVLARVNGLPLLGDSSLGAMLRVTPVEREEPAVPPPAFAAFFDTLDA